MLPTTKSSVAELTACPEVNKAHAAACGFPDLVDAHHQLKIRAALLNTLLAHLLLSEPSLTTPAERSGSMNNHFIFTSVLQGGTLTFKETFSHLQHCLFAAPMNDSYRRALQY